VNEQETAGSAATTQGELKERLREAGAEVGARAEGLKETARSTIEEARTAATEKTEAAKGQAAEEISRTARGLAAAADELEGSPLQQDLLREASEGLKQIAQAVQGKSVGELAGDLSDFGRRNPVAFLGGAALAGFALGRFARAAAPSAGADTGGDARAYATDRLYESDPGAGVEPNVPYPSGASPVGGSEPNVPYSAGSSSSAPDVPYSAGSTPVGPSAGQMSPAATSRSNSDG
jgi:hypothetical protein